MLFRKRIARFITRVFCIWMILIAISRAADLYSSMKIKLIIVQLTLRSSRKKVALVHLHRAQKMFIISNKWLREQGTQFIIYDSYLSQERIEFFFDLKILFLFFFIFIFIFFSSWRKTIFFIIFQIRNNHIIYVQSSIRHSWSSRTKTSCSKIGSNGLKFGHSKPIYRYQTLSSYIWLIVEYIVQHKHVNIQEMSCWFDVQKFHKENKRFR